MTTNTFKRGQSSKEALSVGLTKERKIEILNKIKQKSLGRYDFGIGESDSLIYNITTSFYDWTGGLPIRVLEFWSDEPKIPKKWLLEHEWNFCLKYLKPITVGFIQKDAGTSYRHQYIIKRDLEDLVIEIMV